MHTSPASYASTHITLVGALRVPVLDKVQGLGGGQVLDNGQVPGRCPYLVKDCGGWVWILGFGYAIQLPAPGNDVKLLGDADQVHGLRLGLSSIFLEFGHPPPL